MFNVWMKRRNDGTGCQVTQAAGHGLPGGVAEFARRVVARGSDYLQGFHVSQQWNNHLEQTWDSTTNQNQQPRFNNQPEPTTKVQQPNPMI